MREKIGFFFIALLAVVAGLAIHHFTLGGVEREERATARKALEQKQEADTASLRAEGDATRLALEQLAEETRQVREALEKSPAPALDQAAMLMQQDFVAVQAMRLAVTESYMSMGRMPADNEAAGLPAAESYRGKTLRTATVLPDGTIELVFDEKSGTEGGRVLLRPDISRADSMGIQWHCETPDYSLIKRIVPICEYTADAAPSSNAP